MPAPMSAPVALQTERLELNRPRPMDRDDLFALCSDPRVWAHFPSLRQTKPAQTVSMIERWSRSWASDGLGPWVVRRLGGEAVIGYGGCTMLAGTVWNLGYRFAPDAQGHGYATELAHEALRCAARSAPDLPVVAYLVEHNSASARVAEKLGFELVHRGRDAGNPDPSAVRLVYASRPLSDAQLEVVLH